MEKRIPPKSLEMQSLREVDGMIALSQTSRIAGEIACTNPLESAADSARREQSSAAGGEAPRRGTCKIRASARYGSRAARAGRRDESVEGSAEVGGHNRFVIGQCWTTKARSCTGGTSASGFFGGSNEAARIGDME